MRHWRTIEGRSFRKRIEAFAPTDSGETVMKKELFEDLIASMQEAGKIRKGLLKPSRVFKYDSMDVKKVRSRLNVSQSQFALMMGVSIATLQNWEQGRRYE
jgi:putative transcriptional regulator